MEREMGIVVMRKTKNVKRKAEDVKRNLFLREELWH